MSPAVLRAMLLQEQERYDLAEAELLKHLAAEPEDGFAHALLSHGFLNRDRLDDAEAEARRAVGLLPDDAFCHYVLARVMVGRNRLLEALAAALEAMRLRPEDPDYHSLIAAIHFDRAKWNEALAAAESGLRLDPEHEGCNNLRAMALVKLGRKAEAGATIGATLAVNPENPFSHANQGWTLLEQGQRKAAMEHFRESLRLDPTNDWARAGLLEAMKAGNPVYALLLRYFLWMQKLPGGVQWGIFIGGYLGNRMLGELSAGNPAWAPWITPIRIAYVSFAILTWLASPLLNLTLFLHPMGRHALGGDERWQARLVGTCLLVAIGALGCWLGLGRQDGYLVMALVFGLLSVPVAGVFNCPRGWPRWTMAGFAGILFCVGLTAVVLLTFVQPRARSGLGRTAMGSLNLFLIGFLLSQWIGNFLASVRPRR